MVGNTSVSRKTLCAFCLSMPYNAVQHSALEECCDPSTLPSPWCAPPCCSPLCCAVSWCAYLYGDPPMSLCRLYHVCLPCGDHHAVTPHVMHYHLYAPTCCAPPCCALLCPGCCSRVCRAFLSCTTMSPGCSLPGCALTLCTTLFALLCRFFTVLFLHVCLIMLCIIRNAPSCLSPPHCVLCQMPC